MSFATVSAQDYSDYLNAAKKHLQNGNIEKAELVYNVYKQLSGQIVPDLERICKSSIVKQTGYIDLQLPSGTLWNSQNESSKYSFDQALMKFNGEALPSEKQFQELSDNCNWEWYDNGKVYGYILRSKYNSNAIFLPADNGYWQFHVTDNRFENEKMGSGVDMFMDGAFFRGFANHRETKYNIRLVATQMRSSY